jgi:hypothetical protein
MDRERRFFPELFKGAGFVRHFLPVLAPVLDPSRLFEDGKEREEETGSGIPCPL